MQVWPQPLSVPGKKFDSQQPAVFKLILLPTPCCYELDIIGNPCIRELIVTKPSEIRETAMLHSTYATTLNVKSCSDRFSCIRLVKQIIFEQKIVLHWNADYKEATVWSNAWRTTWHITFCTLGCSFVKTGIPFLVLQRLLQKFLSVPVCALVAITPKLVPITLEKATNERFAFTIRHSENKKVM